MKNRNRKGTTPKDSPLYIYSGLFRKQITKFCTCGIQNVCKARQINELQINIWFRGSYFLHPPCFSMFFNRNAIHNRPQYVEWLAVTPLLFKFLK